MSLWIDEAPALAATRKGRLGARRERPFDALQRRSELGSLLQAKIRQRPLAGVSAFQGLEQRAEAVDQGADPRLGDRVTAGAADEDGIRRQGDALAGRGKRHVAGGQQRVDLVLVLSLDVDDLAPLAD